MHSNILDVLVVEEVLEDRVVIIMLVLVALGIEVVLMVLGIEVVLMLALGILVELVHDAIETNSLYS